MSLGPYPERSWSLSKHKEFVECPRKYFFSTYEQWGGWELAAPERKQRAYRLKKLFSFHAYLGRIIHDEIAAALRKSAFSIEESLSRVRKRLINAFNDSLNKQTRWEMDPKSIVMFQEVYYEREKWNKQAADSQINELENKARTCLQNFAASNSFKRLQRENCEIVEIEEGFPSFQLDGLKIFSVVDLLFRKSDGSMWIIDWKTGKPNEDYEERQLKIYSMYVQQQHNIALEEIYCTDEFLLEGESVGYSFTEEDISIEKQRIRFSNKKMEELLADVKLNKPKDMSDFPKRSDGHCQFCSFREICLSDSSRSSITPEARSKEQNETTANSKTRIISRLPPGINRIIVDSPLRDEYGTSYDELEEQFLWKERMAEMDSEMLTDEEDY